LAKKDKAAKRKAKKGKATKLARTEKHELNREMRKYKADAREIMPTRPVEHILLDLDNMLLNRVGQLQVLPAIAYDYIDHTDLRVWCNQRGIYGLPTDETIAWLREFIGDRSAIELGSGNGAFGRALKVPLTDSRIQEDPEVKMSYMIQGQPTVPYANDVEKLEALEALAKYNPQVAFGSWLTNWIDPNKPFIAGAGSMYGLKEDLILAHPGLEAYVVIGNEEVHRNKPIMALPHETIRAPWIRSRSRSPELNAIFVWRTEGSRPLPSA
jgi:hypothetical protein